ncbi:hypothetical protein [Enterococcus sp. LJL51]|uniref:hypothetical protein n=1 Tax=Enterococcus sp. LJL51 TaxID=3416656 RepID=UPI003CECEC0C
MKKSVNKWMISIIVVSILSVGIIGFFGYKLISQPSMENMRERQPMDGELPNDGDRPEDGPPGMEGNSEMESSEAADI